MSPGTYVTLAIVSYRHGQDNVILANILQVDSTLTINLKTTARVNIFDF